MIKNQRGKGVKDYGKCVTDIVATREHTGSMEHIVASSHPHLEYFSR